MGGVDCHFENLITCGVDPVLVDLETFLQPRHWRSQSERAEGPSAPSVMRTGLLPQWKSPAAGGLPLDVSALGCQSPQPTLYLQRVWRRINTDQMSFDEVPAPLVPRHNRTFVDGSGLFLSAFEDSLLEGFEEMYRRILAERDLWLGQPEPVARLRACAIRILLRATATYGKIIRDGGTPELLRDGVAWGVHADVISAPWLGRDPAHPLRSAIAEEHRALMVGDVPKFETVAGSEDLKSAGGWELKGFVPTSAFDDFLERVARLDLDDMGTHLETIRRALAVWDMVRRGATEFEIYLASTLSPT
jgi:lantibiotic modifying enzyme